MKDFKDSFDQRSWEFAASSHARAKEALRRLEGLPEFEKRAEFWRDLKARAEKQFPCLKSP